MIIMLLPPRGKMPVHRASDHPLTPPGLVRIHLLGVDVNPLPGNSDTPANLRIRQGGLAQQVANEPSVLMPERIQVPRSGVSPRTKGKLHFAGFTNVVAYHLSINQSA